MSNTAGWVIPAISAGASLLGTVVGGLVGYWSSTKMHERTMAAEESRRRNAQLLDGSMAFITGIENMGVGELALARIAREWGPRAAGLAAAGSDEEVLEAARAIHPAISAGGSRVQIIVQLAKATGVFDDEVRRATALLSEIRLLAPADVAESAQRVLYSAFTVHLTGLAAAPELNRTATFKYSEAVNDFFNRVRHHMNVEDIDFDFANEDLLLDVLELERGARRSGRG